MGRVSKVLRNLKHSTRGVQHHITAKTDEALVYYVTLVRE